jgi:hypothetical protein
VVTTLGVGATHDHRDRGAGITLSQRHAGSGCLSAINQSWLGVLP